MLRQLFAQQVQAVADQLIERAPELADDPEKLGRFCHNLMLEQGHYAGVAADAASALSQDRAPWWGFTATDKNGGEMKVKSPKSLSEALKNPQWLFSYTSILSVVLNPVCRGIFGISGVSVAMFECDAEAPPGPRILA